MIKLGNYLNYNFFLYLILFFFLIFHRWRTLAYPEKTTDLLQQITDKLYHVKLYPVNLATARYQITDKLYHVKLYQVNLATARYQITDKLYHVKLYQVNHWQTLSCEVVSSKQPGYQTHKLRWWYTLITYVGVKSTTIQS